MGGLSGTPFDPRLRIVVKAADQTVSNSVVLVNDTHLKFAVAAYEAWAFLLFLLVNSTAVADYKILMTGPAGSQVFLARSSDQDIQGSFTSIGLGRGVDAFQLNSGIIINQATPGNLQFQFAQNFAEVSDTEVLKDSCLVLLRIA